MKYTDTQIVFEEIPDEITLCINVSNCGIHCQGCHSKHLWDDIGDNLDHDAIDRLIAQNKGVSCVCFMGHGPKNGWVCILAFAVHIKEKYKDIKVALYSGNDELPIDRLSVFDYVKVGPYISELGPLNSPTTNQRMYRNNGNGEWEDITKQYQTKK